MKSESTLKITIGKWPIIIVVGIALLSAIGSAVLRYLKLEDWYWAIDAVGMLGTVASLGGVVLAILQIRQANAQIANLKTVSDATCAAVNENRKEIRTILSFSDLAHLSEMINSTQDNLIKNEINIAYIRLRDIKDNMIRVHQSTTTLIEGSEDYKLKLADIISHISVDVDELIKYLRCKKKTDSTTDFDTIISHLNQSKEIIVELEQKIKTTKI